MNQHLVFNENIKSYDLNNNTFLISLKCININSK